MESSTPVNVLNPSESKRATSTTSATTSFAFRTGERARTYGLYACLFAVGLSYWYAVSSHAEAPDSSEVSAGLEAKVEQLRAREDAAYAGLAIERAEAALEAAAAAEDAAARSRALERAHAAMVLAERQLERRLVQERLVETQERVTATRERALAQRRVLEALMKERAAVARSGERP